MQGPEQDSNLHLPANARALGRASYYRHPVLVFIPSYAIRSVCPSFRAVMLTLRGLLISAKRGGVEPHLDANSQQASRIELH